MFHENFGSKVVGKHGIGNYCQVLKGGAVTDCVAQLVGYWLAGADVLSSNLHGALSSLFFFFNRFYDM